MSLGGKAERGKQGWTAGQVNSVKFEGKNGQKQRGIKHNVIAVQEEISGIGRARVGTLQSS